MSEKVCSGCGGSITAIEEEGNNEQEGKGFLTAQYHHKKSQ
jgi:hypothetical protein